MSVNNILKSDRSSMNLGVVKVNNRNYIAVLHYRTEDGDPLEIKGTMLKAKAQYARLFQKVIDTYHQENEPVKVNSSGFLIKGGTIFWYEDMHTQGAWRAFIRALENPTLVLEIEESKGTTYVELVPEGRFDPKKTGFDLFDKDFRDC